MKNIKLNLWTSNLGHVKVTPIDNENSEVMDLLNNANGDYDFDIVNEVEEMSQLGYVECYLADPSLASSVTVVDENGTETEYESYLEENDVVASYDLIDAAEQNDVKVVGEDGPVPERLLERIKAGDEILSNLVRVKVIKNKVAPPFKKAEFDLMFNEGISHAGELLDLGVEKGIVTKSGSWFSYDGNKLAQGRDGAKKVLMDNPDLAAEIEAKLMDALKK